MSKAFLIVESPTKARTIKRYLGKTYDVDATMGHIKDLPKSSLGVDAENGFKADYKVKADKKDVVKRLKKIAASASTVYLAPDPDREGEAIAWHVAEELKKTNIPMKRVVFHEITKKAILEALKHPTEINKALYDAQMARRSMDRIVGYTMSPLLWKNVRRGLSGGRVQSIALRLICMRQDEIDAFDAEEYWTIDTILATSKKEEISARVIIPKKIPDKDAAAGIVDTIQKAPEITIKKITKKTRNRHPLPPFITSTLQQSASSRLNFSAKKTMRVAQQLYEGLAIGGNEVSGLITYMRTDSPVLSSEAINQARTFIPKELGKAYLNDKPRQFKAKKSAQEAHEAIRPTSIENTPDTLKKYLNKDQLALYGLIWKRFVASQMKSALFDQTSLDIAASDVSLRANGSIMRFDGFLKVYDLKEEKDSLLPVDIKEKDILGLTEITPKQHFTQPPPRFTEASLIKELEDKGIGRPSTYAPTISTIQEREYVRMETRAFIPTELGRDVNMLLVQNYPNILDFGFTARMEDMLDSIEEGAVQYGSAMETFYNTYSKEHDQAKKNMENLKTKERPSGIKCDKCGADMLIKLGRNGHFLGCANYPECSNTMDFTRDEKGTILVTKRPEPEQTDVKCDKCGADMVIKHGKYGPFFACSRYPECKNTRPLEADKPTDIKCDKCGANMVIKHGRYGAFLGCSRYPECKNIKPLPMGLKCPIPGCKGEITQQRSRKGKTYYKCSQKDCPFISWTRPVEKKCPECGVDFLIEKDNQLICPNPECSHEEDKG
ncbi:MAG: type I DNA topoisomerase [Thermodesulfobacteriota bacterium]|nr:type I DNA topoisomerase [Thermodesulfobacteriota bacterium]